jgi:hypothetical protein
MVRYEPEATSLCMKRGARREIMNLLQRLLM